MRIFILTLLAMVAFAGNSLFCRIALTQTRIDAASFTLIRICSGAVVLCFVVALRRRKPAETGSWISASALFAYAAGFSFAYLTLSAGTGALLLFGAVQATMIFWGLRNGERLRLAQWFGLVLAIGGLVALLLPGLSAPPIRGAILMICAGVAWGIYSLRGKAVGDAVSTTAGNFLRALVFAIALTIALISWSKLDYAGIIYASLSGAVASGLGYVIWYSALPCLKAASAASVQLSVPILAAVGGILFLNESITLRLFIAAVAVVGGIGLVVVEKASAD